MSESILDSFDKKVAKDKAAAEKQDKGNTVIDNIKEVTKKPNEPKGVGSKVNNSKPSNKETAVKEPDKAKDPVKDSATAEPKGEVTPPQELVTKSTNTADDSKTKEGAEDNMDKDNKENVSKEAKAKAQKGTKEETKCKDKAEDKKEPVQKSADNIVAEQADTFAKSLGVIKKAYDLQNEYAEKTVTHLDQIEKSFNMLKDSLKEIKEALVSHETGETIENPEEETKKSLDLEHKGEHIAKSTSGAGEVPVARESSTEATEEVKKSLDTGKAVEGKDKPNGNAAPTNLAKEAANLTSQFFNRVSQEHATMDSVKLNTLNQLQGKVKYGTADNDDLQAFIDFANGK
jgi:hypothetical protein